jgi:hypothetical protein
MLTSISNSKLIKPLTFLLLAAILHLPFVSSASVSNEYPFPPVKKSETIELRAGTLVSVELLSNISSDMLSPGQTVDFRVKYDVVHKKKRLIEAGSIAKGQITKVKKRKIFGAPGQLEIQLQFIQAVDGQQIPVTGIPMKIVGQNRYLLAYGISVPLFFFTIIGGGAGFFIKGKPAEIPAGTTMNASVASNVEIEVDVLP